MRERIVAQLFYKIPITYCTRLQHVQIYIAILYTLFIKLHVQHWGLQEILDCKQSPFCLKIHAEECKDERNVSECASVICEAASRR